MRKSILLSILTLISVLALALGACSRPNRDESAIVKAPQVRAGELVIKFKDGASSEQMQKVLKSYGHVETLDGRNNIYLVKDKGLNSEEKDAAADLSENSAVEFAEPNFVVSVHGVPKDPMWLSLWGLKNYGQDAPNGVEGAEGADIGVQEVWQKTTGDKSVVVAIVDTGVDYTHPDLQENIWVNEKEKTGVPGVDDDGNGYVDDIHGWDAVSDHRDRPFFGKIGDPDPMDDNSHGTHVAGTIGAVGGNGIGVVGVNWKVSIMAVKFLSADGSGSSADEYRSLQYVLANNVDVVNGSYGGGAPSKLIEFALSEGARKGILFVFAAGNDSANNDMEPSFPAGYHLPNIISVAATDSRDRLADFSNFGQKTVHIAAPGVNILSTVPVSMATTLGPYDVYSGTSMATPHVTGAVALLLAADPSLRKNPVAIKERLLSTVDFKPHLASLVSSGGRLSVANAVAGRSSTGLDLRGQWTSIPYSLITPEYSTEKLDQAWPIEVPGARAIRIHIRFAQVEANFDSAAIYDGAYRPAYYISGELHDEWSPIILGSKAYLKFSNALVSIDDGTPFANFNSAGIVIDQVEYLK